MYAIQVALPHYRERWFLARAAARYKRFLHLHRLHGRTTLIPPPDIDLCWRTHQVTAGLLSVPRPPAFGGLVAPSGAAGVVISKTGVSMVGGLQLSPEVRV